MLNGDIDALNDYVSERITGSECGLSDIQYRVIGTRDNAILLETHACVEWDLLGTDQSVAG